MKKRISSSDAFERHRQRLHEGHDFLPVAKIAAGDITENKRVNEDLFGIEKFAQHAIG